MAENKHLAKITIDKIVMCGFSAIKQKTEVHLDKHTNLIDGPSNAVKQTIPLAIDFILNPTYQLEYLALGCRNTEITDEDRSYVTLHISSDRNIELNGKSGKHFAVTRFLSGRRVDFVYFSGKNKLKIKTFHAQLIQISAPAELSHRRSQRINTVFSRNRCKLKCIRINDAIISERTYPTTFDWNQLFVNSFSGRELTTLIKDNEYRLKCNLPIDLLCLERDRMKQAKNLLIELRTTAALLLKAELQILGAKRLNEIHVARTMQGRLKFCTQIDKCEAIQRRHFNDYKEKLDTVQHFQRIDFVLINIALDKVFEKFVSDTQNQEYHPQFIAGEMQIDCEKLIANAESHQTSIQRNKEYKKTLQLVHENHELIKNLRDAIADEMSKHSKSHINSVIVSRNSLALINAWADVQMEFDEFCETQTILDPLSIVSFSAGYKALTTQLAYDMNIAQNLIGNLFNYVKPTTDDELLKTIVPYLCEYFASFIFETKAASDGFAEIVKPFLKNGGRVYSYSIEEFYPLRSQNLPYPPVSEFDVLLPAALQRSEIRSVFDNFVICTENVESENLRETAIAQHCNIIHGTKCYCYNGRILTNRNRSEDGTIKDFLEKWQKVNMKWQDAFNLKMFIDTTAPNDNGGVKEHSITEYFLKMQQCINDLYNMTVSLVVWEKLKMEQDVEINVNKEKLALLEANYADPVLNLKQVQFIRCMEQANDVIVEFEEHVLNTVLNGCGKGWVPLEQFDRFSREAERLKKDLPTLKTCNNKDKFNIVDMVPENELTPMCKQLNDHNEHVEKFHGALSKFTNIKKYPKLMEDDLDSLSIEIDANYYGLLDQVPDDLYLPNLDANFDYFPIHFKNLNAFSKMTADYNKEISNNLTELSSERNFVEVYFLGLMNIAKYLNGLIGGTNELGFEIDFGHQRQFIFPDTNLDFDLARYTINQLCSKCTGLGFVIKNSETGEMIAPTDLFDMQCHRFGLLFHLALSITMNPSLVILNHTIIGHPRNSLKNIIQRFQTIYEADDLIDERAFKKRQLIVVSRKQNDYDGILVRGFKRFTCHTDGTISVEIVLPIDDDLS